MTSQQIGIALEILMALIGLAALVCYFQSNRGMSISQARKAFKEKSIEAIDRAKELKGDPEIEAQFRPLVEMARSRFPDYHVWGQFIQNGTGYGIYVANEHHKSCFQVLSRILVNGEQKIADIRTLKDSKEAIRQAFDAVEKSLKEAEQRMASQKVEAHAG
jgi:hypothetical protein